MKKLILLRGPQGSGKSTWLKQTGLDGFSLSMDQLRIASSGLVLQNNGQWGINQDQPETVLHLFKRLAAERMERGELLVIEAAMMDVSDMKYWMEKAAFHRYQLILVDLCDMPKDQILSQNMSRPVHLQVSERVVGRTISRLLDSVQDTPTELKRFGWKEDGSHWAEVDEWLKVPMIDLSHYKKIIHIGDLQGCLSVLTGVGGLLEHGFEDDTHYFLLGDLLDRGIENGEVMQWVSKEVIGNPHVTLIWGNHEDHLHRWARGLKAVSQEFAQKTLPQLLQKGITSSDAEAVCQKAVEVVAYTFHSHQVLVSHAGLSTVPDRLERVSARQLSKGTGQWSDPIDQQFERQAPRPWEQVHGHRNHNSQLIQATERSFSLEDNIEYGGTLRVATLTSMGWQTKAYPNPIYLPYRSRNLREDELTTQMPWMKESMDKCLSAADLQIMRQHPGVKEKTSESAPHVASFNFTKDVFFNQSWDDVVVRARGLFFNQNTGEIVARSYDKFFNFDEPGIAETSPSNLEQNLAWPIVGYQKENGFLGLVGYDSSTDSLFLTSKSTPDSDFAGWFREIFQETVSITKQEELKRTLRDQECCCVFEVNDPIKDRGHMIEYADRHLVLLDVFARSASLQKLELDALDRFGKKFGFLVKQKEVRLPNWMAFSGWSNKVKNNLQHQVNGAYTEGVVFEDAKGFQFKIKYPYYAFWKSMRGCKERMRNVRDRKGMNEKAKEASIQTIVNRYTHPLAQAFLGWCEQQTVETLKQELIDLRSQFEKEVTQDPTWISTPWDQTAQLKSVAPNPVAKSPKVK